MDNDEKRKLVWEQTVIISKYFLDWRYKLLAGYIVIISALYYFMLTWISQPEHFSISVYFLSCSAGIVLSFLFLFLNHRNNEVIWKHHNNGYMYEKRLGLIDSNEKNPLYGLFGTIVYKGIKDRVDKEKTPHIALTKRDWRSLVDPRTHTGSINWFFILGILSFFILLFRISSLNK